MSRPLRRARAVDVAAYAGVSVATVSFVVNGKAEGRVSPATRLRVLDAIAALGYVTDASARALATGRRRQVALLAHDMTNPFTAQVAAGAAAGIAEATGGTGHLLLLLGSDESGPDVEPVGAATVDGVLINYPGTLPAGRPDLRWCTSTTRPPAGTRCRWTSRSAPASWPATSPPSATAGCSTWAPAPVVDLHPAPRRLHRRAVRRGPRRGGARRPLRHRPGRRRAAGHRARAALARRRRHRRGGRDRPPGHRRARRLAAAGVPVPARLSVAAFDDIPFAAVATPPLTTVALPARELGRRGAVLLAEVIAGDRTEPGEPVVLPAHLVVRDSTGPAC